MVTWLPFCRICFGLFALGGLATLQCYFSWLLRHCDSTAVSVICFEYSV
uniref:Uncharacterized protein n=1 Tax=Arundo donax TaxID=35708 RepID=A0A0A9BRR8_ARUDO